MANIEKLKKLMVFVRDQMCHKTDCRKCDYNNPDGICYSISDIMRDSLSVIEQMEQKIKDKDDSIRSMSDEITELKEHIKVCFGECAYLSECDPVKFALCEVWKGGESG